MAAPEILLVPPVAAIGHFRAKGHHVGFDWRDTDAAEHLRSFTVAKAMRLDVLQDIRSAVDSALAEGRSFAQFHKELEPLLREKDWWGRGARLDPKTGKIETAQLGSARRLRIIYDTNLRMAHAKGRWERIERTAEARPWLRYVAVQDARTRPEHMAWHGTVLPWDHPFWETHYPPCGWRCRCVVVQLSDDDLEAFGFTPSGTPPAGWDKARPWTNKRTGETVQVPVGIDPGFQHNVGLLKPVAPAQKHLAEKIAAAPPDLAKAAEAKELDDWVALGRGERERLVEEAGRIGAVDFEPRLREAIRRELRERRGAGQVAAEVGRDGGSAAAVQRVKEAAALLPRSWIEAANRVPLKVVRGGKRGAHWSAHAWGDGAGRIRLSDAKKSPSVALHEYTHHIQDAAPDLDAVFIALHRRRTKDANSEVLYEHLPKEKGRPDDYIERYTGREYFRKGGLHPAEVITTSVEQVLHTPRGRDFLARLALDDPEMLDLVLGLLLHYDPV
ncbi:MAG: phage minor head protein [Rhodospirillaceae bacterium]|nr:phage minor head protein [Rhodospirillaceae bacterium]